MAANREEPNMEYVPMEGDAVGRFRFGRATKVLLAVSGLLGVAAVAIMMKSTAHNPEAVTLLQVPRGQPWRLAKEAPTMAHQLSKVTTVRAFNKMMIETFVVDHEQLFVALPARWFDVLFKNFLATIGSAAPTVMGTVPEPRRRFGSDEEHQHRLAIFKESILRILQKNAKMYARDQSSHRMRHGITVHADWTKDEFLQTRLNMRATDLSKFPIRKSQPTKPKVSQKMDNRTYHAKERKLGCDIETGGHCYVFSCSASRGSTCYEHQCICTDGACANADGVCERANGCQLATGGSCHMFGCGSWRNAECVEGACVCSPGQCAVDGACQESAGPSPSPSGIKCSNSWSGPVRDQGTCGDCWAFSTAQQLRYMTYQKYSQDPGTMSVQYLVDCMDEVQGASCSDGVKGCCGGLPYRADQWLAQNGGLPTQADYGPLKSGQQPNQAFRCRSSVPKTVTPSRSVNVYHSEMDIANGLCDNGPVSVAINANDYIQDYVGGVIDVDSCPADQIDHAVLYTGIVEDIDGGSPGHIILNSWGKNWGVGADGSGSGGGHMVFRFGDNVCNILALPSQPEDVTM